MMIILALELVAKIIMLIFFLDHEKRVKCNFNLIFLTIMFCTSHDKRFLSEMDSKFTRGTFVSLTVKVALGVCFAWITIIDMEKLD